jgi:betaine-aldehyde dehydrogenase
VFDDVDIEKAVEWVLFGCFWTNGQICSATSRLLVHEAVADKLLARCVGENLHARFREGVIFLKAQGPILFVLVSSLAEEAAKIHIGAPTAEENLYRKGMLGPVVSRQQYERVMAHIEGALAEGAQVIAGARRPPHCDKGFFVEPTILRVQSNHKIWKEEVFGPVYSPFFQLIDFDSHHNVLWQVML